MKRVLLDPCVPRGVAKELPHCEVKSFHQGWAALKNGELLRAAQNAGFEVFITSDKNIRHQQQIAGMPLAIMPTNRLQSLLSLFSLIAQTVDAARPGSFHEIKSP